MIWAGHVLLIVNTASKCGLTGQYEGLQRIFDDYAMRGFFVIWHALQPVR